MRKIVFMTYGYSPALVCARNQIAEWGYALTEDPMLASHVLLPVPSLEENGNVKGAGPLPKLREETWILGGNLDGIEHRKADLLQDEYYLRENAAITAHCAMTRLERPAGKRVLILGLGRIGRVLGTLLQEQGATVDMAVRRKEKWDEATALGFTPVWMDDMDPGTYDCIFNTVPSPVMDQAAARKDAVLVDLASQRGISGDKPEWARGLPGKEAPQLSGGLIAKTALRYALDKEERICR